VSTYAIIGGTLWGNRGAEAMVVTTIGRIRDREPDASFVLLSYLPERDRALLDDPAIQVIDARPKQTLIQAGFALASRILGIVGLRLPDAALPRSVRALRGCRALLDVSGISFHDGRLAVVAYNVMCLWPAMLLGVPVIRLSQAMGPFRRRLNRLPARWMATRAFHTFARGHLTAEYVRELGIPDDRWSVAADVAFAYRPTDSLTSENDERVAELGTGLAEVRAGGTEVVALVPSSLVMQKMSGEGGDYVALLHDLVRDLHARGRHVLVMPNATRADVDALRNNDIAVVTALRARIDAAPDGVDQSAISYVDFDLNTASIRSLAAPCRLVITSRFHAMVAALALGVPTLVMGWSHKYEEVLEMFGSARDAVDFSSAADSLLPMVDRLLADGEATSDRILKALPAVTASAESQFDLLDRLPDRTP
jgi:colanic acid/amylovoran biosynthesis protein